MVNVTENRLYKGKIAEYRREMEKEKQFTRSEIAKNDNENQVLLILHDKVYNVKSFLNEHPGGEEVLLDHENKDGSDDFDDVGHSHDAIELMKKYQIGVLVESDRKNKPPKKGWIVGQSKNSKKTNNELNVPLFVYVGGLALIVALLFYAY